MSNIHGKSLATWQKEYPVLKDLMALRPTHWFNPQAKPAAEGLAGVGLDNEAIAKAADCLKRFAPYFVEAFPDTRATNGILESPIAAVPMFKRWLEQRSGVAIPGSFWLKQDSHLPISGSIKARGGIYEVLQHAENLALKAGKLSLADNYAQLHSPEYKQFFSQYSVAVGSTGNLGLSIGIMSAALGFKASVHMSAEARQWKKDKLRSHGVNVVEYEADYSEAVKMGRQEAAHDPNAYFVDDENSKTLFVGYAVAAHRLAGQFQSMDILVDEEHPLFVYLPCGVGGGPGGVAFGLKETFGDNVHCIFCEPTHCPSMFLGVYTGLHNETSVQDFGIDNKTAADGLACGRPSGFVGRAMQYCIDGYYTMSDEDMFRHLAQCFESDGVFMEPSSATSLSGPLHVLANKEYQERMRFTPKKLARATHLAWITGGSMVPENERRAYLDKGRELLRA